LSITLDVEHCDFDESKQAILQEPREETLEPPNWEFNDDILSIEYESFSCGFDVNVSFGADLCAEYESFSFEPIQPDLLF